jgi:hypothetical protein
MNECDRAHAGTTSFEERHDGRRVTYSLSHSPETAQSHQGTAETVEYFREEAGYRKWVSDTLYGSGRTGGERGLGRARQARVRALTANGSIS